MSARSRSIRCWIPFACLALLPAAARTQIIDFETFPNGAATVDQQTVSGEYATYGVTFSLLSRTTGLPIGSPRIAKAGTPQTAFEGCLAADTPLSHLGLGQSFLTDGTTVGAVEGDLRIDYATPVLQASGVILDVDCRVGGGSDCEQWTITAYDGSGTELNHVVVDALRGAINPYCQSPEAGPGDSNAIGFSISAGGGLISTIILRYTGTAANVGLAFDNFSVAGAPGPLEVTATFAVGTICAGEPVTLSAVAGGGYPPYTFQWEQEAGPASWVAVGSASTQIVSPNATTTYRATVTDASAQQTNSLPFTVEVSGGSPLCAAELLVSSGNLDEIVSFSFLSGRTRVFVSAGSGGLNAPSDLVCGNDGNLYVTSQLNNAVLRYDGATGAFVDVFVTAGRGGLNVPVGLGFGPDGNLYVVSNTTSSVLRYDGNTGAFIDAFVPTGSGLNLPTGLVFGPDHNLYVCSRGSNKVLRFDGTTGAALGDFVTTASGGLNAPRGLVFGPDGNLYIAEELNDSVRRYDGSTGAFLGVFVASGSGGLDRANDVLFGLDGRLYVASYNNNRVLAFDAGTGAYAGDLPNQFLDGPAWLALSCQAPASGVRDALLPLRQLTVEPSVPNPFNPRTTVSFTVTQPGAARVEVIDLAGHLVATLLRRDLTAGRHTVTWNGLGDNGRAAPSGVYLVRVQAGGASVGAKVALVR